MKTNFKYIWVALAMFGMIAVSAMVNPHIASAQTESISPSNIKSAYFSRGYFKKEGADWNEYDGAGNLRYVFREVRRDNSSVYLKEDNLQVDLQIDAVRRMISAEWPGSPRQDLYRITNMEIEEPTIGTPPQPPNPPVIKGPIVDLEVSGPTLTSVDYASGTFKKSGEKHWDVELPFGGRFLIDQIGVNLDHVYLYDRSRSVFYEIDVKDKWIRQSTGGAITDLYKISDMSSSQVQPPSGPEVTERPGTMSQEERRACAAKGGTVERAGILGAERCTLRYTDGGLICTDSSQCQGKCLAGTDDANKSNITGTCQKTDNPFGCYAEVKNGKSDFALCVD